MMADSAPVLIWLADRERKCIYFNQTWLQFTGRTLNEELGEGWSKGVHPDDRPECLKVCHAAFANLQPFEMEFRLRRADAQYRWVLNSGVPRFDDDGTFAGYIGSLIDITDRRRAEERSRYQAALLDKAQDAILVQDLNSRLISWNKGAERIYGWAASEAIGERADDLLFKDPSAALEARRAVVENGEWTGELRQVNKNGKELFIQSRWTLVQDPDSNAILVINTDISEKKTLENQFLRVQRLESIGVLAGGIAHDLNNVLVPILVVAELLRTLPRESQGVSLIGFHGHTVRHLANEQITMQIGNPWLLAEKTGMRVVSDFRRHEKRTWTAPLGGAGRSVLRRSRRVVGRGRRVLRAGRRSLRGARRSRRSERRWQRTRRHDS
jgi:hypothetical protein